MPDAPMTPFDGRQQWELDTVRQTLQDAKASGRPIPLVGTADSVMARLQRAAPQFGVDPSSYTPGFTPGEAKWWQNNINPATLAGAARQRTIAPVGPSGGYADKYDVPGAQPTTQPAPLGAQPPSWAPPAVQMGNGQVNFPASSGYGIPTPQHYQIPNVAGQGPLGVIKAIPQAAEFGAAEATGFATNALRSILGMVDPQGLPTAPGTPPGAADRFAQAEAHSLALQRGEGQQIQSEAAYLGNKAIGRTPAQASVAAQSATGAAPLIPQAADFVARQILGVVPYLKETYIKPGWQQAIINAIAHPVRTGIDLNVLHAATGISMDGLMKIAPQLREARVIQWGQAAEAGAQDFAAKVAGAPGRAAKAAAQSVMDRFRSGTLTPEEAASQIRNAAGLGEEPPEAAGPAPALPRGPKPPGTPPSAAPPNESFIIPPRPVDPNTPLPELTDAQLAGEIAKRQAIQQKAESLGLNTSVGDPRLDALHQEALRRAGEEPGSVPPGSTARTAPKPAPVTTAESPAPHVDITTPGEAPLPTQVPSAGQQAQVADLRTPSIPWRVGATLFHPDLGSVQVRAVNKAEGTVTVVNQGGGVRTVPSASLSKTAPATATAPQEAAPQVTPPSPYGRGGTLVIPLGTPGWHPVLGTVKSTNESSAAYHPELGPVRTVGFNARTNEVIVSDSHWQEHEVPPNTLFKTPEEAGLSAPAQTPATPPVTPQVEPGPSLGTAPLGQRRPDEEAAATPVQPWLRPGNTVFHDSGEAVRVEAIHPDGLVTVEDTHFKNHVVPVSELSENRPKLADRTPGPISAASRREGRSEPEAPSVAAPMPQETTAAEGSTQTAPVGHAESTQAQEAPVVRQGIPGIRVAHGQTSGEIRVYFPNAPEGHVRTSLKENGFRWDPNNKRWYAPPTEKREALVRKMQGLPETTAPPATGETQVPTPVTETAPTTKNEGKAAPEEVKPEPKPAQVTEHADLVPGTSALIEQLRQALTHAGIKDNPALNKIATEALGGTPASGHYTSADVYDALEAAVNQYVLKHGPRWLVQPVDVALNNLEGLMAKLPTQSTRSEDKKLNQQFSTPPTLGYLVAKAANIGPGDLVLEPSAGVGGLAVWAKAAGADVHVNEWTARRRALLELLGFKDVTGVDAEKLNDMLPYEIKPTVIVMNPPFSATGGRTANNPKVGAAHVLSALKRLEPGGRLVAIVGQGMTMEPRTNGSMSAARQATGDMFVPWWSQVTSEYNVLANLGLPGKAYQKYGTTFANQLLIIDKTGPTPGETYNDRRRHVLKGEYDSVEEAVNAIHGIGVSRTQPVREGVANDSGRLQPGPGGERAATGSTGGGVRPESERADVGSETAPARSAESPEAVSERQPGSRNQPEQPAQEVSSGNRGGSAPDVLGEADHAGGSEAAAAGPDHAVEAAPKPAKKAAAPKAEKLPEVAKQPEVVRKDEGAFTTYQPAKFKGGVAPKANIVESTSMAAVDPPDLTYVPHVDPAVVKSGDLSNIQLEAISYAGQRHSQMLPNGQRAAFFIGDGTGVGKGREIAGIIQDNWRQGRRRSLWVSKTSDLIKAAQGDFKDSGGGDLPIHSTKESKKGDDLDKKFGDSVVFTSYDSLKTRFEDLVKWLGNDGVVVFDEAHKAKNAVNSGRGKASGTGLAVVQLQEKIPNLRVVYSSATGMTDVENMGYMTRLGLWGPGTSFGSFANFAGEIDGGGVGAMEMVARDMKALGMYTARTLSYEGVDYQDVTHELTAPQRSAYDAAAKAWRIVREHFESAAKANGGGNQQKAQAMQGYYSLQQQFFSQLLMAFKLPTLIQEIEGATQKGYAPVVSFINTGESRMSQKTADADAAGQDYDDLDLSPASLIRGLVEKNYPTERYHDETDPYSGKPVKVIVRDAQGNAVHSREALEKKEQLLRELNQLKLPDAPLDALIDYFGENQVAEMTGRTKRLKVNPKTGKRELVKRGGYGKEVSQENLNIAEMDAFQSGRKPIALISGASSTGISLHASNRAANKKRRYHITWQTDWSADQQMQFFGRTHRTDQASAPIYALLATDVGGEKRFMSTIARRLESLGALTKGSREASSGGDLAKYNFETAQGRAAVQDTIVRLNANTLDDMGLLKADGSVNRDDAQNVPKFLNRVLALPLDAQNHVFGSFIANFDRIVSNAKASGTFDEGVADIKGDAIRLAGPPEVVATEPTTKAETVHYTVEVDTKTHPITWANAEKSRATPFFHVVGYYRQKVSGNIIQVSETNAITDTKTGSVHEAVLIGTPAELRSHKIHKTELDAKYEPITDPEEARSLWDEKYAEVPRVKTKTVHIIGGAILPLWERFRSAKAERLKVVRLVTDNGQRIVGMEIEPKEVRRVLKALGIQQSALTVPDAIAMVMQKHESIPLVGGLILKPGKLHNEPVIEIGGAIYQYKLDLKIKGARYEQTPYGDKFFIPTDPKLAEETMGRILERWPPSDAEAGFVSLRAVAPVADALRSGFDLMMNGFAAASKTPKAKVASTVLREHLASDIARAWDRMDAATQDARKIFARMSRAEISTFIDHMEHGQDNGSLEPLAQVFREILDTRRAAVQKTKPGTLSSFIEDYFPHIWKDPKKAATLFQTVFSKRPMEGPKSFLKKRTLDFFLDGIAAGLEPVSWNPVDLVMYKAREMDRWLMAHKVKKELQKRGYIVFRKSASSLRAPAGYTALDDKMFSPKYVNENKELVISGRYFAPDAVARIVNNYVAQGLRRNQLYRGYMSASNFENQLQLGLSAFHAAFTTKTAFISSLALAFDKAAQGQIMGAIKTPFAENPVQMFLKGGQLAEEWAVPGTHPELKEIADALVAAGGRAHQDTFYATNYAKQMKEAFEDVRVQPTVPGKAGSAAKGAVLSPLALIEGTASVTLKHFVPRMKLGLFYDMAKDELARLGKLYPTEHTATGKIKKGSGIPHDVFTHAMGDLWDSVENRMGQLTYDDTFWNKYVKDIGMALFRALGWKAGTVREIGGGIIDLGRLVPGGGNGGGINPPPPGGPVGGGAFGHKEPWQSVVSRRTTFNAGLLLSTALMGGLYYFWKHGKAPDSLHHWFHPPDAGGTEKEMGTYLKEVEHLLTEPMNWLLGSGLNPVPTNVIEAARGVDSRNVKIVDQHPVADYANYEKRFLTPFSLSQIGQSREKGEPIGEQVETGLGITDVPRYETQTKAQREAAQFTGAQLPGEPRTQFQDQKSQLKAALRAKIKAKVDVKPQIAALERQGILSRAEAVSLYKTASESTLEREFKVLPIESALQVFRDANPQERLELRRDLLIKFRDPSARGFVRGIPKSALVNLHTAIRNGDDISAALGAVVVMKVAASAKQQQTMQHTRAVLGGFTSP